MKQELDNLKSKIQEIKTIEVGINVNNSPTSFDIVFISEFDTEQALEKYLNHPEHIRVGEFVSEIREERIIVDFIA